MTPLSQANGSSSPTVSICCSDEDAESTRRKDELTRSEALTLLRTPSHHRTRLPTNDSNDAPTPLISNCIPKALPPSLELAPPPPLSASSMLRTPRFSSDTTPPIVMQRPLKSSPTTDLTLSLWHQPHRGQQYFVTSRRHASSQQQRQPTLLLTSSTLRCHSSMLQGSSDDGERLLVLTLSTILSFACARAALLVVPSASGDRSSLRRKQRLLPPSKHSTAATQSIPPPSHQSSLPRHSGGGATAGASSGRPSHFTARSYGGVSSGPLVRGIPNYGQTCFMNSVLQALASMEPFVSYLEHVALLQLPLPSNDLSYLHSASAPSPTKGLCSELLHLVHSINGTTSYRPVGSGSSSSSSTESNGSNLSSRLRRRLMMSSTASVDPRNILRRVGQQHAQFKPKVANMVGREQQDAQEFLQALLGMVADDAGITTTPSTVACFRPSLESSHNLSDGHEEYLPDLDDVLTVVSGARERKSPSPELTGQTIASYSSDDESSVEASTLSSYSSRIGSPLLSASALGRTNGSRLSNGSNGFHHPEHSYDEKKQDEYSPLISPYNPSEDKLFDLDSDHIRSNGGVAVDEGDEHDTASVSDLSSKERHLSAAIRRMIATTSSITPTPLCGWMGSALQCRTCRHVRPIQNAPFLEIPVVPTNVSNYLHSRNNLSKFRPTDVGPPCTLEKCLEDFTSVERVHDVECRSCTYKREMAELESEALLLSNGIEALLSKAKKRGHGSTDLDPVKHLRSELGVVQSKLAALRLSSPDDEGAMERILAPDHPIGDEAPKIQLHRSDAFKCLLLTRLPAVLCIHVQRRFYDPETNRTTKTAQHVIFPEYLDVGPFCAYGGSLGENAWAGTTSSCSQEAQQRSVHYRLMSVIVHAGGAYFGHYVTYRRDPASGRWLLISDDAVRSVDWNVVKNSQAYMLFYEAL